MAAPFAGGSLNGIPLSSNHERTQTAHPFGFLDRRFFSRAAHSSHRLRPPRRSQLWARREHDEASKVRRGLGREEGRRRGVARRMDRAPSRARPSAMAKSAIWENMPTTALRDRPACLLSSRGRVRQSEGPPALSSDLPDEEATALWRDPTVNSALACRAGKLIGRNPGPGSWIPLVDRKGYSPRVPAATTAQIFPAPAGIWRSRARG